MITKQIEKNSVLEISQKKIRLILCLNINRKVENAAWTQAVAIHCVLVHPRSVYFQVSLK